MTKWVARCALLGLVLMFPRASWAQAADQEALRVFLDCQFFCDFDHLRREITYVNWVRDRQDAQVHVLVTTQQTGGGGTEYTFAFIGLENFAGVRDTLLHVEGPTDTEDERRTDITRVLKLGLVRYVARLAIAENIDVVHAAPQQERSVAAAPGDDAWNFWVFRTRLGGGLNGEERQRSYRINGSLSANRTTEDFKITLSANGSYNNDKFELSDGTEFESTSSSLSWSGLAVWSMGEHWSAGGTGRVSASTFFNQDLNIRVTPAVEYNVYPYSESTRRQLTFMYSAGIQGFKYEEETIFDRTSEVHPIHEFEVSLSVRQPWGSINTSVEAFQFLHDLGKHSVEFFGSVNVRLFRGLELNLFGSIERTKDQIYLEKGGATDEEVLLRRRQLGTDYRYFTNISLRYTFGSIFNNVVNPRFEGGGGGFFFF